MNLRPKARSFVRKLRRVSVYIIPMFCGLAYLIFYEDSFFRDEDYSMADFMKLEYFDNDINEIIAPWNRNSTLHLYQEPSHVGNKPCPPYPKKLTGMLPVNDMLQLRSWSEIENQNQDVAEGQYSPTKCTPRYKVAIIIPLRGRESQLRIFLSHMLPIWKKQNIHYKVFVISQSEGELFNRAKLFNIGVAEVRRDGRYDCYVFHDTDLLLEDDRCLYTCYEGNPRHLSMHIDSFSYNPLRYRLVCRDYERSLTIYEKFLQLTQMGPEVQIFGGVSMLTSKQFDTINGFSNLYWGWGGEDDEIYVRLTTKGYAVENPYGRRCSYRMIPHEHEGSNPTNFGRWSMVRYVAMRIDKEGFSTLRYQVISRTSNRLYANITVNLGHPSSEMLNYISKSSNSTFKCFLKMPWSIG